MSTHTTPVRASVQKAKHEAFVSAALDQIRRDPKRGWVHTREHSRVHSGERQGRLPKQFGH
jgi:hypothetical protein